MSQTPNSKIFDLEERTFEFAKRARDFVNKIPKTLPNIEYGRQFIRSTGSVGANYIEANESLGKKDFLYRIRISKKEAKESRLWSRLIEPGNINELLNEQKWLINESTELMKIFGSIIERSK